MIPPLPPGADEYLGTGDRSGVAGPRAYDPSIRTGARLAGPLVVADVNGVVWEIPDRLQNGPDAVLDGTGVVYRGVY